MHIPDEDYVLLHIDRENGYATFRNLKTDEIMHAYIVVNMNDGKLRVRKK